VLFLHETHNVVGTRHDEFEAAYREGWMPTLANDDNARLLWYANHAHGSGRSYTVVTITGIADGASWESLARRTQQGDLRPWMRELDNLRHEVTGKLLLPVAWYLAVGSHQRAFGIPVAIVALTVLILLFSPTALRWAAGGDQRGPASSASGGPDSR